LLNCENGTLNLETFELHPHRREDFLTQRARAAYDPQAECPTWLAFLGKIMAENDAMIRFLKDAAGYTLTGVTTAQCMFILYGRGQNGKSTFVNTLRDMMGDYGYHAAFDTFLYNRHHSIRNDLAALRGMRCVTAVEADPGERLSESVIKTITGEDPITARFLNREFFTYLPQYKLLLAVNDKPIIRGGSKGTWRRIRLVPFNVEIKDSEIDDALRAKLEAEWPGILAWAVRGCENWRRSKLEVPEEVRTATREYQDEMKPLGAFLSDCCVEDR
jgi:putative DNA primase/helicase